MKNLDSAPSSLRTVTSYELLITLILLLFSSCNRINNPNVGQSVSLCTDSLWTPTGNAELDSLLQLAATAPRDTNLVELYSDIGNLYFYSLSDIEKSKEYQFKLKELSEELNWNEGIYIFAADLGNLLVNEGLLDSVLVIQQEALEFAKKEMNEPAIASIFVNLGIINSKKKCYETALEYYFQALSLYEKLENKQGLAQVYDRIGICYDDLSMYDMGKLYYEKAFLIYDETPNSIDRAMALINYSLVLRDMTEFEKEESCLLEAQRICEFLNNKYHLISIYINLSHVYLKQNDWDKAEKYCDKAMELILELNDIMGYCIVTKGYGAIAMYRGNFNQSEKYIREALKTAEEYDMPQQIVECYRDLSRLAVAQHDFINHRLYSAIADSLQNELISEENRLNAKELETKYETEKKQLEIERQKTIIEKQNLQRGIFIGGIAICVAVLALLFFLLRLRIRHNKTLTEKNEILDEINATKDKFFSIISHDLRSPAIAQREAIQLLCNKAQQWDKATLLDYSQNMLQSADSQVELLNNLLSWAQLQSGRMDCVPLPANLSVTLDSVLTLIRKIAEAKGVTLHAELPEEFIATVDANMISTVVRNLLANAVK
ncbi:MAG: tetratricopeptide repeat protein, partial [Bacteroidales bacterium]|nr:tetratricopeptide repeat protein [Bacteroidales bacterium]